MRTRRLSAQLLASQLTVLLVALPVGFALFIQTVRDNTDHQFEQRALDIAQATAEEPMIRTDMAAGDPDHEVARLAEQMRAGTGAAYVVVVDRAGIRHSHPNPRLIGEVVDSPLLALDGHGHVRTNWSGTLGPSANGMAPLRAPDGDIIGQVSAGLLERDVSAEVWRQLPTLLLYLALVLCLGVMTSLLLARRLKRRTFGLELDEITELLQEREAMLHGIREGVVTLGPTGRVSLVNDEARRLLRLGTAAIGQRLDDVLPAGRLRDLISGDAGAVDDETVLTASHCLTVNRMAVTRNGRPLGAVVTLRDRTELVGLMRELDSVRGLTDALRAQQHEHANRMHTLAGLLDLGRPDEAAAYLAEVSGAPSALAETLRDRIGDATLVALLLAKVTIAAERGVRLDIAVEPGWHEYAAGEPALSRRSLVTVVGNLIDNALDAVAGRGEPLVRVRFAGAGGGVVLSVSDNGPGVPDGVDVFEDGYTTKAQRDGVHRGLGLALSRRLVTRAGGTIEVRNEGGARFRVALPAAKPVRAGVLAGGHH